MSDLDLGLIGNPAFGALIDRRGRVAWACCPRSDGTVAAIERRLKRGRQLAAPGRGEEAPDLFDNLLDCRNHLGLLSEDIDPETGELWGNFPQTYSMVGPINSAIQPGRSWREAF